MSSDIVQTLSPEFRFVKGCKLSPQSSAHYVILENDNKDTIKIYNSYDRKLAFNIALYNDISVDLGINRVVHKGKTANSVVKDLTDNKQDLLDAVKNSKKIHEFLSKTTCTEKIAKDISDIIFAPHLKQKNFKCYNNYVDLLIPRKISIKNYIKQSMKNYIKGDYTIETNSSKRLGRKCASITAKVVKEMQINKLLKKTYPELYL